MEIDLLIMNQDILLNLSRMKIAPFEYALSGVVSFHKAEFA